MRLPISRGIVRLMCALITRTDVIALNGKLIERLTDPRATGDSSRVDDVPLSILLLQEDVAPIATLHA